MSTFPFSDLHSFKDYVGFVKLCAPDLFPVREGVSAEEQWTLDYAFVGLREGLALSIAEKGARPEFEEFSKHIENAFKLYAARRDKAGYDELDDAHRILKRIPSQ